MVVHATRRATSCQAATWCATACLLLLPSLFSPARLPAAGLSSASALLPAFQRPLPDEEPFFAAARENLARSTRAQNRYAYKERRAELHMNPFGRLGTGGIRVYEVTPEPDGSAVTRRLIERD